MTTQVVPFTFESLAVRVVVLDNKPMFSARDVALALSYSNPSKAYNDHCKCLKKLSYNELLELNWENPNPQGEYVIPEADVYRMIVKSEKPEAERFEKWLFEDVLPSIRKTGSYAVSTTKPTPVADVILLKNRQAKSTLNLYLSAAKLRSPAWMPGDHRRLEPLRNDPIRQATRRCESAWSRASGGS